MVAGLVSRVCLYTRGEIMIGSSTNSDGAVVGALACGIECSGFKPCFIFWFFFSLLEIFVSSHRISVHNEILMQYYAIMAIEARGMCSTEL